MNTDSDPSSQGGSWLTGGVLSSGLESWGVYVCVSLLCSLDLTDRLCSIFILKNRVS